MTVYKERPYVEKVEPWVVELVRKERVEKERVEKERPRAEVPAPPPEALCRRCGSPVYEDRLYCALCKGFEAEEVPEPKWESE